MPNLSERQNSLTGNPLTGRLEGVPFPLFPRENGDGGEESSNSPFPLMVSGILTLTTIAGCGPSIPVEKQATAGGQIYNQEEVSHFSNQDLETSIERLFQKIEQNNQLIEDFQLRNGAEQLLDEAKFDNKQMILLMSELLFRTAVNKNQELSQPNWLEDRNLSSNPEETDFDKALMVLAFLYSDQARLDSYSNDYNIEIDLNSERANLITSQRLAVLYLQRAMGSDVWEKAIADYVKVGGKVEELSFAPDSLKPGYSVENANKMYRLWLANFKAMAMIPNNSGETEMLVDALEDRYAQTLENTSFTNLYQWSDFLESYFNLAQLSPELVAQIMADPFLSLPENSSDLEQLKEKVINEIMEQSFFDETTGKVRIKIRDSIPATMSLTPAEYLSSLKLNWQNFFLFSLASGPENASGPFQTIIVASGEKLSILDSPGDNGHLITEISAGTKIPFLGRKLEEGEYTYIEISFPSGEKGYLRLEEGEYGVIEHISWDSYFRKEHSLLFLYLVIGAVPNLNKIGPGISPLGTLETEIFNNGLSEKSLEALVIAWKDLTMLPSNEGKWLLSLPKYAKTLLYLLNK